ncbi:hypothetical protein LPJ54_004070 [Coemansia sp. RSA 1824]|nr:hypothetical protein LPJ54_004070 [Coemansia sp. RSA 1824]
MHWQETQKQQARGRKTRAAGPIHLHKPTQPRFSADVHNSAFGGQLAYSQQMPSDGQTQSSGRARDEKAETRKKARLALPTTEKEGPQKSHSVEGGTKNPIACTHF